MVEIIENKDITSFTTFGIPVKARYFAEYSSERELLALSRKEEFLNNGYPSYRRRQQSTFS